MKFLEQLNQSLEYLEENMDQRIEIEEAAKRTCTSKFHYQRMFHMVTGVTVAEYIRKRRLTLAAQELQQGQKKVLEVALRYGYQTPESFSKAFVKLHGVTPSEAKRPGVRLQAVPKMSFQIQIKGEVTMKYRMEEKEAFTVMGVERRISTVDGRNYVEIPQFWNEIWDVPQGALMTEAVGKLGFLGICADLDEEQSEFTYMIAIEGDETRDQGLTIREIPAQTWAVFESTGPLPKSIQGVWDRIFSEWFPSTGFEHANAPELEIYPLGETGSEDYSCEIWIPIKKM
jgi:AraC family transcriptional regulator